MKSIRWRGIFTVFLLIIALWSLWPTYRFYTMTPEEREKTLPTELSILQKKALNLGLDLKGGMYLLLKVDQSKLTEEEKEGAIDRAIEVIRNRVDQWGVFEPSIQKIGEERILVQLPGVLDRERARSLIGRTALLEFKLVAGDEITQDFLKKIDDLLRNQSPDTLSVMDTLSEELGPFTSLLRGDGYGNILVPEDNVKEVEEIISREEVKSLLSSRYEFVWGRKEELQGMKFRRLYLLEMDTKLKGSELKTARHTIGSGTDPTIANKPLVLISFNRRGTARFARITGENVGRKLAIVLDGVVQSAPVIRERIAGGNAQISGIESMEEAKELAVVLKAGALPAPVDIMEERSVGPFLGKDSIKKGITALGIGFSLVVLFMLIYYNLSGSIAVTALILNIIFILALLSGFHATLTLPGLAGLILTVGMAVDANVLIFERIREELRAGKTPKIAVDSGYKRATITIFDANLTTLVAALVLLRFGTGPIRGFAVVLSLGIVVSFFTAVFVTKIIFDYLIMVKKMKRVRI